MTWPGERVVQDEVRVAERAELGDVEPLDLASGDTRIFMKRFATREDHPRDAPRPDEADDDLEHLRDELAARRRRTGRRDVAAPTPFQPAPYVPSANRPTASTPHAPHTPWTEIAPHGSSTSPTWSKNHTL